MANGNAAATFDAVMERVEEARMGTVRRQEGRAFRRGYADATVFRMNVGRWAPTLRLAYLEGYHKRREEDGWPPDRR